jgi:phosphatidylserine decarboxylase
MTARSWEAARPYVLAPAALGGGLVLLGRWRFAGAAFALAGAALLFFRDPERALDREPGVVYAPADGFVREVGEVEEPLLPGGRGERISTFLSLHNVHVNRSPVAGRVEAMEEVGGGFAPALFSGADDNKRLRSLIRGERGPVVIVQKSGAIARRISPWVAPGDTVSTGERIGIIHFGSRTDVVLPAGAAERLVSVGDRVRAGLTPIARYRPSGP